MDVLDIALEEHLYAFVDCARELASPATSAWRFGVAHVTFDLANIQHISVPASCEMTTPDRRSDLELAACNAGCDLTGDVGGFSIAEGLAQGEGSRGARHDCALKMKTLLLESRGQAMEGL